MLARQSLPLKQLASLTLQFRIAHFELAVLTVEFSAQFNEVRNLGFEGLDEFLGHDSYTGTMEW